MLKSVLVSLVLIASVTSFAKGEKMAAKDAEVKKACSAEIATSNCGDKSFGKGLMKCMHAYKQAHKEMVVSDSCKALKGEFKAERQAKASEVKPPATK